MGENNRKSKTIYFEKPRVKKTDNISIDPIEQGEEIPHSIGFTISPPKVVINGVVSSETEKGSHVTERFIWELEKQVPVQITSVPKGVLPCGQRKDLQRWADRTEDKNAEGVKDNTSNNNDKEKNQ